MCPAGPRACSRRAPDVIAENVARTARGEPPLNAIRFGDLMARMAQVSATLVVAAAVLLRLAHRRHRVRDDGHRRDRAHGILAAAAAADRRVRVGPRPCGRRLLVRLPLLGRPEPDRRPGHGAPRPPHRYLDRRRPDVGWPAARRRASNAVASLCDARCRWSAAAPT